MSLRIKVIALADVALAIIVSSVWWFHSVTISLPLPPLSPKKNTATAPHLRRLNFRIDTTTGPGPIAIVNQGQFAWNEVLVEVSDGDGLFQCPALPVVGTGHTVMIRNELCRSTDGYVPTHVCLVRVAAREGGITLGLEPCLPLP